MEEILNNALFNENYCRIKNKIYRITNENARDETLDFLNKTRKLYAESRANAAKYMDNVDVHVKKCFQHMDELIESFPIPH